MIYLKLHPFSSVSNRPLGIDPKKGTGTAYESFVRVRISYLFGISEKLIFSMFFCLHVTTCVKILRMPGEFLLFRSSHWLHETIPDFTS